MNSQSVLQIKPSSEMLPLDERIYCKPNGIYQIKGCGSVKKYFIERLSMCACEFCDISENGVKKSMKELIACGDAKHLIHDLDKYSSDILDYKKINTTKYSQYQLINSKYLPKIKKVHEHLSEFVKVINELKDRTEDKNKLFDQKEAIRFQSLIQELSFNDQGKVENNSIGSDTTKQAKLVWICLIMRNLKKENFSTKQTNLTDDLKKSLEKIIDEYVNVHDDTKDLVDCMGKEYIPEVSVVDSKNVEEDLKKLLPRIYCKEKLKSAPVTKPIEKPLANDVLSLKKRIAELEIIISTDRDLHEKNSKIYADMINNQRNSSHISAVTATNSIIDPHDKAKWEKLLDEEKKKFDLCFLDNKNLLHKVTELSNKVEYYEKELRSTDLEMREMKGNLERKYDIALKEKLDLEQIVKAQENKIYDLNHYLNNNHNGIYNDKERDLHIHTINDLNKKVNDLTDQVNYERSQGSKRNNTNVDHILIENKALKNTIELLKLPNSNMLTNNNFTPNNHVGNTVNANHTNAYPIDNNRRNTTLEFDKFADHLKNNPRNTYDPSHTSHSNNNDYWDRFVKDMNEKKYK